MIDLNLLNPVIAEQVYLLMERMERRSASPWGWDIPDNEDPVKASAERLHSFLSMFYRKGERIVFFPMINNTEVQNNLQGDPRFPDEIHGIATKWWNGDIITRFSEGLTASLGSKTFLNTYKKLQDWNNAGYDIYFTANPLFGRRSIKVGIREIRHIVLECDHNELSDQAAAACALMGSIAAVVYSGSRSLHLYVRMEKPIPNPFFEPSWKAQKDYDPNEARPLAVDGYSDYVQEWFDLLKEKGLSPCDVTRNFAHRIRLPGFRHHGSGKICCLLGINRSAYHSRGTGIPWDPSVPGVLTTASQGREREGENTDEMPMALVHSAEENRRLIEDQYIAETPMIPRTTDHGKNRATFLDSLDIWLSLRKSGIPHRHVRRALHHHVLVAAAVMGWDDSDLYGEWDSIVSLHQGNIGCTPEEACDDLIRHRRRRFWARASLVLPILSSLPDADISREQPAVDRLDALNCPESCSVARLARRLFHGKIKEAPSACREGRLALRHRDMEYHCAPTPHGRRLLRPALQWMDEHNILRMTDHRYEPKARSRLYRLNIHLVLWLLDFRPAELQWYGGPPATPSLDIEPMPIVPLPAGWD